MHAFQRQRKSNLPIEPFVRKRNDISIYIPNDNYVKKILQSHSRKPVDELSDKQTALALRQSGFFRFRIEWFLLWLPRCQTHTSCTAPVPSRAVLQWHLSAPRSPGPCIQAVPIFSSIVAVFMELDCLSYLTVRSTHHLASLYILYPINTTSPRVHVVQEMVNPQYRIPRPPVLFCSVLDQTQRRMSTEGSELAAIQTTLFFGGASGTSESVPPYLMHAKGDSEERDDRFTFYVSYKLGGNSLPSCRALALSMGAFFLKCKNNSVEYQRYIDYQP